MEYLREKEVWLLVGSQDLYGQKVLNNVERHGKEVAEFFDGIKDLPVKIVFMGVMSSEEKITQACLAANTSSRCVGVIIWCHTFSPGQMWMAGLSQLQKPILHLHTQMDHEIPIGINMDYMNENQSAHGDREEGYALTELRKRRKIVVGHYSEDPYVRASIQVWSRAALAWDNWQNLTVAKIGGKMRNVAVTECSPNLVKSKMGVTVADYGPADALRFIQKVSQERVIDQALDLYDEAFAVEERLASGSQDNDALLEAIKQTIGIRDFLESVNASAFTINFQNLPGFSRLPFLAAQILMSEGYGYGAEGDARTAAMVYACKVMGMGLVGGASFMEHYVNSFSTGHVLGAHMGEVCPSLSALSSFIPECIIAHLGIGGKKPPVRLIFDADAGPAINISLVEVNGALRLIANPVNIIEPPDYPDLPVARALWQPVPDLKTEFTAWSLLGGAHHTALTQALSMEYFIDFARIAGIQLFIIDEKTDLLKLEADLGLR